MAALNVSSSCPCGKPLSAFVKTPQRQDTHVVKLSCPECASRFQLVGQIRKGEPGRVFNYHFEILELSEKACEALKPKAPDVAPIP